MNLRELVGGYNEVKGTHSRSQHLLRELINDAYMLLIVVALVNQYNGPLVWLIIVLPIDLITYRISVIRRLHDLGVPNEEVNTSFWMPLFSYKLWWRLLTERGRN
jgi:uncharacterized membrane protein YhaH (DUF805 family)